MNHAPLDIGLNNAALQSFGMPDERQARIAARRAFVELKQVFMHAAADIDGPLAEILQRKVRMATEASELWDLRIVVLNSLDPRHANTPRHRLALRHRLDSMFAPSRSDTSFAPL